MRLILLGIGSIVIGQFALPAAADEPAAKNQIIEILGRIVRVDPDKKIIVLQRGRGENATETEYTLASCAKILGIDRKPLADGLRNKGLGKGAQVWCRLEMTAETPRTITQLRLFSSPDK